MQQNRSTEMSRRRVLAKGAAIGGVAWAAPTVTAITLSPANAAAPSGEPEPPKPPKPPEPPEPTEPPRSHEPTTTPSATPSEPGKPTTENPDRDKPRAPVPSGTPSPDHVAGGGELADTGMGDVAKTVALGGALAAGGAVLYGAKRSQRPRSGDEGGSTA